MRRVTFALMSTIAAVVRLFGYRTSTPTPTSAATGIVAAAGTSSATGTTATAPSTAPSTAPTTTPTSTPTTTPTAGGTSTATGQVVQTRWGPVQVQITVGGGHVTAVTVLEQPTGNGRDVQINDRALPVLKQETLQAQSAHIDSVSGATVTSNGYTTSLQSALDQAGL